MISTVVDHKIFQYSYINLLFVSPNSLLFLHAKIYFSKFLFISSDGLERSIKFDWVRKSNAIELSHNCFASIAELNRSITEQNVRVVSSGVDCG